MPLITFEIKEILKSVFLQFSNCREANFLFEKYCRKSKAPIMKKQMIMIGPYIIPKMIPQITQLIGTTIKYGNYHDPFVNTSISLVSKLMIYASAALSLVYSL